MTIGCIGIEWYTRGGGVITKGVNYFKIIKKHLFNQCKSNLWDLPVKDKKIWLSEVTAARNAATESGIEKKLGEDSL